MEKSRTEGRGGDDRVTSVCENQVKSEDDVSRSLPYLEIFHSPSQKISVRRSAIAGMLCSVSFR